jgi:hypothetical protein
MGRNLPPTQCARSLGVNTPRREADHSPPSRTEVNKKRSYASAPPTSLHGMRRVQGRPFNPPAHILVFINYSNTYRNYIESPPGVRTTLRFVFERSWLVSKWRSAIGLRYFVGFLSTVTHIPAQYFTLDHEVCLPHPFHLIKHTHCTGTIRCCSLNY